MIFRILTLDGGGTWALIEVHALINLYGEDAKGNDVLRNFDLVAANSGGALVLAALVENLALKEILQYFLSEQNRRALFSPTKILIDKAVSDVLGFGPTHSTAAKLQAIIKFLPRTGGKPLVGIAKDIIGPGGSPVHLLIIGFDYDRNRATFFRSAPASGPSWGEGQPSIVSLADAAHASSTAPVNYFDAPARLPSTPSRYWDGGVSGCNNPALAAVTEARVLDISPEDIRLLALGTGTVVLPLAAPGQPAGPLEAPRADSNFLDDLKKLAGSILDDPPDSATFIAHAIAGGSAGLQPPVVSRIVRMSPMDAVDPLDVTYIEDYCLAWLADQAPNQPIRMNGKIFDPLKPEIGYAKFSEARTAWSQLFSAGVA